MFKLKRLQETNSSVMKFEIARINPPHLSYWIKKQNAKLRSREPPLLCQGNGMLQEAVIWRRKKQYACQASQGIHCVLYWITVTLFPPLRVYKLSPAFQQTENNMEALDVLDKELSTWGSNSREWEVLCQHDFGHFLLTLPPLQDFFRVDLEIGWI